jgi:hypothetical protein
MSDPTGTDPGPSVSPEVQDDLVEAVEEPPAGDDPPGADEVSGAATSSPGDQDRRAEDA